MAWKRTVLTKVLNVKYPIIQAPMAKAVTPQLVASVSNSGAIGSLPAEYQCIETVRESIRRVKSLTDQPFAVNIFCPTTTATTSQITMEQQSLFEERRERMKREIGSMEQLLHSTTTTTTTQQQQPVFATMEEKVQLILSEKVPIFSFTFGIPSDHMIQLLKQQKQQQQTIIMGTANTVDEALALQEAKVDFIVAQGSEAGGHQASFMNNNNNNNNSNVDRLTLHELLRELSSSKNNIFTPVIAAGGIMNGSDIVSAMELGSCGVQLGTAFLTCEESEANELWKQVLLNEALMTKYGTEITKSITGRYARYIRNTIVNRLKEYEDVVYPFGQQLPQLNNVVQCAMKKNNHEYIPMLSGENGHLCNRLPKTASEIVNYLVNDVEKYLRELPFQE